MGGKWNAALPIDAGAGHSATPRQTNRNNRNLEAQQLALTIHGIAIAGWRCA